MTLVPKRRWPRFTLRTLFVVVTVFGVWLGWQLNWIRQRHVYLARRRELFIAQDKLENYNVDEQSLSSYYGSASTSAPWPLRLLGEKGQVEIRIMVFDDLVKQFEPYEDCRLGRSLFPESRITWYILPKVQRNSD
jgi:hypothetical protein